MLHVLGWFCELWEPVLPEFGELGNRRYLRESSGSSFGSSSDQAKKEVPVFSCSCFIQIQSIRLILPPACLTEEESFNGKLFFVSLFSKTNHVVSLVHLLDGQTLVWQFTY